METKPDSYSLTDLYDQRYTDRERAEKRVVWKVLCEDFFQRYVRESDTTLDLGAGYCEFINHIRSENKIAVDLRQETVQAASPGVRVILQPADHLTEIADSSVDVVFSSAMFEHIKNKDELVAILFEMRRILRQGGLLLVLMPNIRYAYREYWDFFDHHLPLSHLSLTEALQMTGYAVEEVRTRFVPYTIKGYLPKSPFLLRVYLRLPFLHRFFGRQMFVVAAKSSVQPSAVHREL